MTRHVTRMTIHDAEHYTEAERQAIIESYPAHEREARSRGIPVLGSGRIYPIAEEQISKSIEIQPEWYHICGMDFGWNHPTAAVWIAQDRDTGALYVYDCYKRKEAPVPIHAASLRARGEWIPVAYPHDGEQHDKGSGIVLAEQYRTEGANMMDAPAVWATGGRGVEAGIQEIMALMETGLFNVKPSLTDWFDEFRLYHRKDGKIHKEYDDLMDATRYAVMMLRDAVQQKKPRALRFKKGIYA